jgi:type IV fimbrial biogenesis protein FimT
MLTRRPFQQGYSLVELAIAMVIVSILLALAAPSYRSWVQNAKIRSTTEAILNGIQLAKTEAVRRNFTVRFQLVSTLDNTCVLGAAGSTSSFPTWVISRDDPTSLCASAPIDEAADLTNPLVVAAPGITRVRSAAEGSSGVVVAAGTGAAAGVPFFRFNGLGRITAGDLASNLIICTGIDETAGSTPVGIAVVSGVTKCVTSPVERRMQVTVTPGGEVRMCDPAFSSTGVTATDPQRCF